MRKILIIALVAMASVRMCAEDTIVSPLRPNLVDSMPGVELIQDSTVGVLLQAAMRGSMELVEIDGYRVQIYSSNQQQTAKAEALDLEDKLRDKLNQTIYVQYLPPFWKVRLGDFRTYTEAKEYKKEFVQMYPEMQGDTYIVRDKIQVLQ
ncbi:MAG: SPOR domain-containing protein [Paludibacteraceae bacterium]|nr:SPOR domain-containing protein [Paludibacteraceae bacterium]